MRAQFDEAMMNVYRTAREECGYIANHLLNMLHEYGGSETARRLLAGRGPQYGLTRLWECGRLDITVECIALSERFRDRFEARELETARQRLRQYGFDPDRCERD